MAYRKSKRKQQNHLIGAMHAHIESMEDRVLLAGELGYLEALKDGVNKSLEDVADLSRELERAALKAGYGSTISPVSLEKLVRAISE